MEDYKNIEKLGTLGAGEEQARRRIGVLTSQPARTAMGNLENELRKMERNPSIPQPPTTLDLAKTQLLRQ